MKIVVVGGGASGLVSAIYGAKNNDEVIILERNSSCAKKILVTGNGRCNYWNMDQEISHYHSSSLEKMDTIITKNHQEEILEFFNDLGIVPKIKNGYYYPYSNQATSIKNALLNEVKRLNIEVIEDFFVERIEKEQDKFYLYSSSKKIDADKVILATGSKACPKTGSDGNGYYLAKNFGHSLVPVLPSLVQLKGNENYFKEWDGVRADVELSLIYENEKLKEETGEIQLTDYGISGICTFNISGLASKLLYEGKIPQVKINFCPFIEKENFENWLEKRNIVMTSPTIEELLEGFLNYKLIIALLKKCHISKTEEWDHLTSLKKQELISSLTELTFEITDTNSFDKAQVCSGGIPLAEVNLDTLESKKVEGLYLVGELLDVDGDCGGYNLGFAWISGMIAGKGASKKC